MFGLEVMLSYGPTAYILLITLLIPFVYCLPNAIIMNDLAGL